MASDTWRLTDTRLTSSEAATIIAALCEHLVAKSLEWVVPFGARDLSISPDGDVLVQPRPPVAPEGVVEVLTRLLRELVELVDNPAPALTAFAASASQDDLAPFRDLTELAGWMEQAFGVRDSRALLCPLAGRMHPSSAMPDAIASPVVAPAFDDMQWADIPLEKPTEVVGLMAPTRGRAARRSAAAALALLAIGVTSLGVIERARRQQVDRASRALAGRAERSGGATTEFPDRTNPPIRVAESAPPISSAPALERRPPQEREPKDPTAGDQRTVAEPRGIPPDTPDIAAPVISPSFDSSGSAMFVPVGRSPQAQLIEGRLDGGEQLVELRALADDGSRNDHVRLSPDGTHVAFDSDRGGERAVYIARRDGTMPRRVSGPGFAAVPTWSPDGARLAFVRGEASRPGVWNLWLLDVASGQHERVTSYPNGQLSGASWFPDGKRVAYSRDASLYLIELTSRTEERLDSPVRGRMLRTPAVSPDGRRIVFQVRGDGVWMLELDDRSMRRILDDSTAEEFTWDSRGARVAYHSRRDGRWRIWITAPPQPPDPTP